MLNKIRADLSSELLREKKETKELSEKNNAQQAHIVNLEISLAGKTSEVV
jgi:hypothetical protein